MKNFRTFTLASELYHQVKKSKAKGVLRDQLYRASLSVCLNLAEGNDRRTQKDRMEFFNIALTSLREVQDIISIESLEALEKKADILGAHL